MENVRALFVLLVLAVASTATAQTNASKASSVGTWKLDLQQSGSGTDPKPKSLTLTIFEDTPQRLSWRVDGVDDKDKPFSYAWSGPRDGSLHPIKAPDGSVLSNDSFKRDGDALLRHSEDPAGSGYFDSRVTMSDDGNTMNEVSTEMFKDGRTPKTDHAVWHRVSGGRQK
jgi:hypothetical protein